MAVAVAIFLPLMACQWQLCGWSAHQPVSRPLLPATVALNRAAGASQNIHIIIIIIIIIKRRSGINPIPPMVIDRD